MSDFFTPFLSTGGFRRTSLKVCFDAQRDAPGLFEAAATLCPQLQEIAGCLRSSLPLVPESGVGSIGNFVRIPNHYRSVAFVLPPAGSEGARSEAGVIVFKGTEPLLPDFPEYLDWMLRAPFRASYLPLGLHFPLDMKLPPAAMWIEECLIEQSITSKIQVEYLAHYGLLARLPVPLFVYQLTPEQVAGYEATVRARLSTAAFKRIEAKVADGLGVEVYYYPTLPVRAADLFVADVRAALKPALTYEAMEETFNEWSRLLSELLHLGYMPYVPWSHGMGACVDPGNACIDGGFSDLLTTVPFDSIPGEHLFWRSLAASIQMLANAITNMCAAATDLRPASQSEQSTVGLAYVTERLRQYIQAARCDGHTVDPRLLRVFESPSINDVVRHLREMHREGYAAQFSPRPAASGGQFVQSGTEAVELARSEEFALTQPASAIEDDLRVRS